MQNSLFVDELYKIIGGYCRLFLNQDAIADQWIPGYDSPTADVNLLIFEFHYSIQIIHLIIW